MLANSGGSFDSGKGWLPPLNIESRDMEQKIKRIYTTDHSGYYEARIDAIIGPRRESEFMACLDLGITGFGEKVLMRIQYHVGEAVDEERVNAAMKKTIAEMDARRTREKIISYKIREIVFIPNKTG